MHVSSFRNASFRSQLVVMNFHYLHIPNEVPASSETTSFVSLGKKRIPESVHYYLPNFKNLHLLKKK